ncbi:S-methyl-5'-thioadenosine phosphorylase [Chloracidobacterium thermophilum]|uniref:S-methyl-5'-thioadenosine phosphorylase n=1 Tax=Chloracidobacterium thermophilum TaxID=458033 RepID=UPI0007385753|nr:S-methyl-5'-thioadenosine phosphorylase [Chloracidobacterium thermophilum]
MTTLPSSPIKYAVIGGSGFYRMEAFEETEELFLDTPFGKPSDAIITGRLDGVPIAFLPRHGRGHLLLPSELPYRANMYALKMLGVEFVISISAVGSLREELKPLDVVIPDQFFDRTRGRTAESTFFGEGIVAHVTFADPVCPVLCDALEAAGRELDGVTVHRGGTYLCMEGPAFSTRAESNVYRQWGMDIIGMTNLQEAKLAREAEMSYATLAMVTDYDCWHQGHADVTVEMVIDYLNRNVATAQRIVRGALRRLAATNPTSPYASALKNAIMTRPDLVFPETRRRLAAIIGKYLPL